MRISKALAIVSVVLLAFVTIATVLAYRIAKRALAWMHPSNTQMGANLLPASLNKPPATARNSCGAGAAGSAGRRERRSSGGPIAGTSTLVG